MHIKLHITHPLISLLHIHILGYSAQPLYYIIEGISSLLQNKTLLFLKAHTCITPADLLYRIKDSYFIYLFIFELFSIIA